MPLYAPIAATANVLAWMATPSSANLAAAVTDETGTGALVFGTSPTFTTSIVGAAGLTIDLATANVWQQRNGTNAQTFYLFNTYTNASNYERGGMSWSGNVLTVGASFAGTGTARAVRLRAGDSSSAAYFEAGTGGFAYVYPTADANNRIQWGRQNIYGTNDFTDQWVLSAGSSGTGYGVFEVYGGAGLVLGTGGVANNPVRFAVNRTEVARFNATTFALVDAINISAGTTTGTMIGTTTSQKIGLWNTTPVVQPTTAVSAAAFVANTSGIVNDTATFGGYTVGQIVAALKSIGALA